VSRAAFVLCLLGLVAPAAAVPPPRLLARLTRLGPVPSDLVLPNVTVVLGIRDRPGLEAAIAAQQDPRAAGFRRWLDAGEIADRFGPRRAQYERVRRWLEAAGFRVTADSPYRLSLSVAGTAAQVEAAFRTRLALYRDRTRTYRVPVADAVLPPELGVQSVLGLDDLPAFHPLVRLGGDLTALAPADVAIAYGTGVLAGRGLTGGGRSIAVVGRSDFLESDVATFGTLFGAPAAQAPVKVPAVAGKLPGRSSDTREETEVLLDVQWAGALAPQAQVNAVLAVPSTAGGGDIPEALRAAVEQRAGDVISMSFGLCEPDTRPSTSEYFDALYAIANAQGQTVLVSSGDDGAADCGGNDPELAVNALAASPHAVAVGGTALDPLFDAGGSATGYGGESAWHDAGGSGGGGQSVRFARPSFQIGLGFDGRVLPDVALAASPGAPGYVIVRQTPRVVGGTSASTPVLASLLALVNEAQGVHGLGQLLPAVYRLGAAQAAGTHAPVFHDVTSGSNGFPAHAGFDLATGWGSPIADAFADGLADVPAGACAQDLDCMVPGAGGHARACLGEWLVDDADLARATAKGSYPTGTPTASQTCRDGDPECDADGVSDGTCTIRVALCVSVADARARDRRGRLRCAPRPTRSVRLVVPRPGDTEPAAASNREALNAAIAQLPAEPAGLRGACTATVPVSVAAGARTTLKARVRAGGAAVARVTLACSP